MNDASERPFLARKLGMQRHPEGGWFVETWRAQHSFTPAGYPGERAAATAIYFLLCPGEESAWHVVRSDEIWLWHRGGPLDLVIGGDGELPKEGTEPIRIGSSIEDGERPQALVPGGMWQSARPAGDEPVLVSCIVSPGFDYADFRLAD
ncbi:cupin domain-containing protein [Streptomyces sp. NPDC050844]|uniref:cupin domain-containing protein n=1 Tax=Streptomyces sp. NPDC050844 TaxID=3155790 RepID=UPI003404BECC